MYPMMTTQKTVIQVIEDAVGRRLTAVEAYALLEEALEAGRLSPAQFRRLEAAVEGREVAS